MIDLSEISDFEYEALKIQANNQLLNKKLTEDEQVLVSMIILKYSLEFTSYTKMSPTDDYETPFIIYTDTKMGLMSKNEVLIPPIFDHLQFLCDHLHVLCPNIYSCYISRPSHNKYRDKYWIINDKGVVLYKKEKYNGIRLVKYSEFFNMVIIPTFGTNDNETAILIDADSGEIKIEPEIYHNIAVLKKPSNFVGDDVLLKVTNHEGKVGCINKNLKEIIPCEYEDIFYVGSGEENNHYLKIYDMVTGLWKIMTIDQKLSSDFIYETVGEMSIDGVFYVVKDGKYAFMDKNLNYLTDFIYDYVGNLKLENKFRGLIDGLYCLIDSNGNTLTKPIYDSVDGLDFLFSSGLSNGLYCLIGPSGEQLTDFIYHNLFHGKKHIRGFFQVERNRLFGVINEDGKEVFGGAIYEDIIVFREDLAAIRKNGVESFVDLKGNLFSSLPESFSS